MKDDGDKNAYDELLDFCLTLLLPDLSSHCVFSSLSRL